MLSVQDFLSIPLRLPQRQRQIVMAVLGLAIALLLGLSSVEAGVATPTATPTGQPGIPITLPQINVSPREENSVARQVVWLDGRRLFAIAVPAVGNTANSAKPNTNAARARVIQRRLEELVRSDFDPANLQVTYKIANQQPVIFVNPDRTDPARDTELMTVTTLDAQINGMTPETWAGELDPIIEAALIRAKQERQSSALQRNGVIALAIFLGVLSVSLILHRLQGGLRQERQTLITQAQDLSADPTTQPNPGTTQLLQRQSTNRQQRRLNEVKRWLMFFGQLGLWGLGLFTIAGLFPYTRAVQPFTLRWLQVPLRLIGITVATYLLIRLSEVIIDRVIWTLKDSATLAPETSQRVALRFSTFARVGKSVVVLLVVGAAVISALYTIGVQVAPLLAGAGIIGLAVSFAAQSVIKDMINGFLILLEDQYGVGDVIVIDAVSGLVENMNLRITQLRNEEGRLITIPNSSITVVQNLSKEWSRVDLAVNVAYQADIDEALSVINQVAQDMSHDRPWKQLILEPPLLLGVDRLDHTGATVRLWIKTQPLKQWEVAREYRRRLKLAFDRADIPIGVPQQSLWLSSSPEELEELPAPLAQSVSKLTGDPNTTPER
ncbi:MAG: mechanosensitive ion channel family protein [Leptolyngbyaceae cyanobacterium SL_7_1]|nr:mechanosensitive ion channel family protein [Leptolyngbyaceae cyanobacterium SL_7_1]